ncbi:MAG: hypothetical protein LBT40_17205 [Deltaproteobacteria bacterium]|jgi:hypothetical protein|nr:hypothetical protein [Deltaproteobacteria bacterium]
MARREGFVGKVLAWPLLLLATAAESVLVAYPYAVSVTFVKVIWVKLLFLVLYVALNCAAPTASVHSSASLRSFPFGAAVLSLAGAWAGYYAYLCMWSFLSAAYPGHEFPGVVSVLSLLVDNHAWKGIMTDHGAWRGLVLSPQELLDFVKRTCESGLWTLTWGPEPPKVGFNLATLYMIWEPIFLTLIVFLAVFREAKARRPS